MLNSSWRGVIGDVAGRNRRRNTGAGVTAGATDTGDTAGGAGKLSGSATGITGNWTGPISGNKSSLVGSAKITRRPLESRTSSTYVNS